MILPSSITTRLQYQHKSLIELIDGLSDTQIRMGVIPGKWSVFEHIVHLETYQLVFADRIKTIIGNDGASFHVYSAETDPLFHDHLEKSSHEVIHELMTRRKEISSSMSMFNGDDLAKKGTHPVYGEMNLTGWLNFFLLHESHHLFTIFKLASLTRLGKY
ncbi:MAG: DinB family protein [Chitinophagaceae bacterium]